MIRIATRGSKLALCQAEIVQQLLYEYCGIKSEFVIVKTKGDQLKDIPLYTVSGAGFFTREIEQAVLNNEADIAVHSLKDLPLVSPEGLRIAALVDRDDAREAVITKPEFADENEPLSLKKDITIGSSAIRRKYQIKSIRPDIKVKDLRGNVTTRIEKLRNGEYDAIMISNAGLVRLGIKFDDLVVKILDPEQFVPSPAQGVIAVESRIDDKDLNLDLIKIHSGKTAMIINAERKLLKLCGGGCHLPLGAHIERQNEKWNMSVFWGYESADGKHGSIKLCDSSDDLDSLVEESYLEIKSKELKDKILNKKREAEKKTSILITRPAEKLNEISVNLSSEKHELIPYPVLKLSQVSGSGDYVSRIDSYDLIIFTSANAVKYFHEIVKDKNLNSQLAAVGGKTALAVKECFGLDAVISPEATGEGLGRYLADKIEKKSIIALFPCAREAGHEMERTLIDFGWKVDRYEIYETLCESEENLPAVNSESVDCYCFTSRLAVEYTFKYLNPFKDAVIISIGPKTSEQIEKSGRKVDWEIPNSNLEWLWRVLQKI